MTILVLFGAGAYLGLHLTVVALLPLSAISAGAIVFAAIACDLTDMTRALLLAWVSVQAGYMVGLTARELTHRARLEAGQSSGLYARFLAGGYFLWKGPMRRRPASGRPQRRSHL